MCINASFMAPYPFPNMADAYSNQVFMNDTTGLNYYTPPFNSYALPFQNFSMDRSIWDMPFNAGCPTVGCGQVAAPVCQTGIPFTGGYYQDMDGYYEKMMENQVSYQKQTRAADMKINAAQRNLRQKGLVLREKIQLNEQDQIMPAFKEFLEAARQFYGDEGSEEDLLSIAKQAYEDQFQVTIQKDIREHGSSSLWHGMKEVWTLGHADNSSAEDNVAKITGAPKSKAEADWEAFGNFLAGTTVGTAAGGAAMFSPKVLDKIPCKTKGGKFALITFAFSALGWLIGKVMKD